MAIAYWQSAWMILRAQDVCPFAADIEAGCCTAWKKPCEPFLDDPHKCLRLYTRYSQAGTYHRTIQVSGQSPGKEKAPDLSLISGGELGAGMTRNSAFD
jgi:hypothetical protein